MRISAANQSNSRTLRVVLLILLVAWLFRITAFEPNESPLTTATIAVVPGIPAATVIALYYIAAIIIVLWPQERHAKSEFREDDPEAWKEDENDDG